MRAAMGSLQKSVVSIAIFAVVETAAGQDTVATPEACFYASVNEKKTRPRGCRGDTLKLAQSSRVLGAIEALKLPSGRIKFEGCLEASFSAAAIGPDAARMTYVVYYPDTDASVEQLLAPVLHELGHVFQIHAAGSAASLRSRYPLKQIELGADFLSGVISGSYLDGVSSNSFADSMQLLGRYWAYSEESHGSPRERAKAYRNGYFLKKAEFESEVVKAYEIFDDERFSRIEDAE